MLIIIERSNYIVNGLIPISLALVIVVKVDVQAHQGYVEAISKLDSTYKKDLLPNIHLNERDLFS